MTRFRILLGVNLLILAFAAWQCGIIATSPLITGSPGGTWLVTVPLVTMLLAMAGVLGGAVMLHHHGRTGTATLLLLIPAIPVILGGLLLIGLVILFTLGAPVR